MNHIINLLFVASLFFASCTRAMEENIVVKAGSETFHFNHQLIEALLKIAPGLTKFIKGPGQEVTLNIEGKVLFILKLRAEGRDTSAFEKYLSPAEQNQLRELVTIESPATATLRIIKSLLNKKDFSAGRKSETCKRLSDLDRRRMRDEENTIIAYNIKQIDRIKSLIDAAINAKENRQEKIDELRECIRKKIYNNSATQNAKTNSINITSFLKEIFKMLDPVISREQKYLELRVSYKRSSKLGLHYTFDRDRLSLAYWEDQYNSIPTIDHVNEDFIRAKLEHQKYFNVLPSASQSMHIKKTYQIVYECLKAITSIEDIIDHLRDIDELIHDHCREIQYCTTKSSKKNKPSKKFLTKTTAEILSTSDENNDSDVSNYSLESDSGEQESVEEACSKTNTKGILLHHAQESFENKSAQPVQSFVRGQRENFEPSWKERRLDTLARLLHAKLTLMSSGDETLRPPRATAVSLATINKGAVFYIATKQNLDDYQIKKAIRSLLDEADEVYNKNNVESYKCIYKNWLYKLWNQENGLDWQKDSRSLHRDFHTTRYHLDLIKLHKLITPGNDRYDATMANTLRQLKIVGIRGERYFHPELALAAHFSSPAKNVELRRNKNAYIYIGCHLKNCLSCHLLIFGKHHAEGSCKILGLTQCFPVQTRGFFTKIYPKSYFPDMCMQLNSANAAELERRIGLYADSLPFKTYSIADQNANLSDSE